MRECEINNEVIIKKTGNQSKNTMLLWRYLKLLMTSSAQLLKITSFVK